MWCRLAANVQLYARVEHIMKVGKGMSFFFLSFFFLSFFLSSLIPFFLFSLLFDCVLVVRLGFRWTRVNYGDWDYGDESFDLAVFHAIAIV